MATAAVNKTADELKSEIAELYRQNREINERLNNRGRRLARGGFLRPIGGRGRGKIRKADNDLEGPPAKKLSSAVVKVNGDAESSRLHRRSETPRVLPKEDDPKLAKRNKRMFGALIGTLEKFRQEEASNSEVITRRSDSLKKAVEKAQEESDKLRQQERESNTERRKRDLMLRARVTAKAEASQVDLLYLDWAKHQEKLAMFLKTKVEPTIYYLPVKQTERDRKQLEEQQKEVEEWKVKRRQELEDYKKEVSEKYVAKAQADIERVGAGRNRRRASEAAEKEDEAAANESNEHYDMIHQEDQQEQGQDLENDALVADVMEEDDDYRPEDDALKPSE